MKKILLFLPLFLMVLLSHAQHKSKFGIRLGASSTGYFGSDYNDFIKDSSMTNKWSPYGGFYINSMVSDYFWIKTEFNFVNRGTVSEEAGFKLRKNYYYLDLYPVIAAFHIEGVQLFAGPSIGILMTGNYQQLDSTGTRVETINLTQDDLDNNNINRLDFGLVAGIEYEFPFGLNAGFRYVRGFSSFAIPQSGQPKFEMYNKAYLVSIGYTIGRNSGKSTTSNYGD